MINETWRPVELSPWLSPCVRRNEMRPWSNENKISCDHATATKSRRSAASTLQTDIYDICIQFATAKFKIMDWSLVYGRSFHKCSRFWDICTYCSCTSSCYMSCFEIDRFFVHYKQTKEIFTIYTQESQWHYSTNMAVLQCIHIAQLDNSHVSINMKCIRVYYSIFVGQ